MRKAIFFDLDTQKDFMRRSGALYVPEAEDIIPRIADLMEYAQDFRILVVSTVDTHVKDDPEFATFPPHCIKGTPGWEKIGGTLFEDRLEFPVNWRGQVPDDLMDRQQLIVEKGTYDPFSNAAMHEIADRINKATCLLFGVATDYCVRFCALGLLEYKCRVNIILNATRPIRERTGREAIEEMKDKGAEFITTAEVLKVAV